MPVTIKSILDAALRKFGAVGTGQQADANEYADALMALRQMLDGWSIEGLMVPFTVTEQFDLATDQAFYSMGTGGDWDTVRPEEIEVVRILDAANVTRRIEPATKGALSWQKTVEAGVPSKYVISRDAQFIWVEFNAYPLDPHVLITSRKPFNTLALENFASPFSEDEEPTTVYPSGFTMTGIQTPLEFPSGYEQALVYNLAVHLRPEYPGLELPAETVALATSSKANIKRANLRVEMLRNPAARMMRRGCDYSIEVGE